MASPPKSDAAGAAAVKQVRKSSSRSSTRLISKRKSKRDAYRERLELKPPATAGRGVIYIQNLPRGFYEYQLRGFFSQFGTITRLRLSRSKKSGVSRCYGWVEFAHAQVAQIAAETMNNYLMYDTIIKCEYKARDELHPRLFKGCHSHFNKNKLTTRAISISRLNKKRSVDQHHFLMGKLQHKLGKKMQKLQDLGVKYEVPMEFPSEAAAARSRRRGMKRSGGTSASKTPGGEVPGSRAADLPASAYLIVDSEDDDITFTMPGAADSAPSTAPHSTVTNVEVTAGASKRPVDKTKKPALPATTKKLSVSKKGSASKNSTSSNKKGATRDKVAATKKKLKVPARNKREAATKERSAASKGSENMKIAPRQIATTKKLKGNEESGGLRKGNKSADKGGRGARSKTGLKGSVTGTSGRINTRAVAKNKTVVAAETQKKGKKDKGKVK